MARSGRSRSRTPRREDVRALVRATIFMGGLFGSLIAYSLAG